MPDPRRRFRFLILFLPLAAAAVLASPLWLPWIGYGLIHDDGPVAADIAVVLAGDAYGHRIERAGELIRQGLVPKALISGPPSYGIHECDLAINMMVREGYPADWFIACPNDAKSTAEEAHLIVRLLKQRGVRGFLLITSTYHTARSRRIFAAELRRSGGGPWFRVVASRDELFRPGDWWRSRDGLKIVVMEWIKSASEAFGI